jgi:Peptidase A4 family
MDRKRDRHLAPRWQALVLIVPVLLSWLVAQSAPASATAALSWSSDTSGNWAGMVAKAPAGAQYFTAQGTFVVPSINCSTAPASARVSIWVGMGGDSNIDDNNLLQNGIEGTCPAGALGSPVWQLFWDTTPSTPLTEGYNLNPPGAFPVSPGDLISVSTLETYVAVCSNGGTCVQLPGPVDFSFDDSGSGHSLPRLLNLQESAPPSALGLSDECIVEAPLSGNNTTFPLADFGSITFTGCGGTENVGADSTTICNVPSGSGCAAGTNFVVAHMVRPSQHSTLRANVQLPSSGAPPQLFTVFWDNF